jgi:hypothetical protein
VDDFLGPDLLKGGVPMSNLLLAFWPNRLPADGTV